MENRSSFVGVSPRCANLQRCSQRKATITQAKVTENRHIVFTHDHALVILGRWTGVPTICNRGFVQVGDSLEEFLLGATQDAKLRQLMMSMSEAIRTIAFKVHMQTWNFALSCRFKSCFAP